MLLHMSTKSPSHVSASNTMLFCPANSILKKIHLRNAIPQIEFFPLGNKALHRGFSRLEGHTDYVRSVAFSADNRLMASGSDDGSAYLGCRNG
ncbi:uncharacterized protein GGS25DRAFT_495496 [Hypoxylon fragiforme]|uniref:uncharacterized protein n=1 Tax=Hypoxylon fragiforme TaxID=63214 RepID=UPI0020C6BDFC|nr:uncharacterized protein GGS25DRAFT_495496 [Hypoxylon fragiforme]KAI2607362.1 hypothetical protein GGS25DRAFT_495496 [Hypoxylon fragiforme]